MKDKIDRLTINPIYINNVVDNCTRGDIYWN